ncbi:MAG: hypothetical protein Q7T57_01190, partial [Dehalococcoidales bacterium]|nr:hypothetical protein [Dehalococcoidales bacterium]
MAWMPRSSSDFSMPPDSPLLSIPLLVMFRRTSTLALTIVAVLSVMLLPSIISASIASESTAKLLPSSSAAEESLFDLESTSIGGPPPPPPPPPPVVKEIMMWIFASNDPTCTGLPLDSNYLFSVGCQDVGINGFPAPIGNNFTTYRIDPITLPEFRFTFYSNAECTGDEESITGKEMTCVKFFDGLYIATNFSQITTSNDADQQVQGWAIPQEEEAQAQPEEQ